LGLSRASSAGGTGSGARWMTSWSGMRAGWERTPRAILDISHRDCGCTSRRLLLHLGRWRNRGPLPERCGGQWCIATGTRGFLSFRRKQPRRHEGAFLLWFRPLSMSFPGGTANDRIVMRDSMISLEIRCGERRPASCCISRFLEVSGPAGASPRGTLAFCCIGVKQP